MRDEPWLKRLHAVHGGAEEFAPYVVGLCTGKRKPVRRPAVQAMWQQLAATL